MRLAPLCTFLAASLAAAPALAQDNADDVIVVEGDREVTVREVRRQARSITPRAGSVGEPLARFQQEVCAGVWGLSPDSARLVIDRIYYNAEKLGLPVTEEEGCVANIVVIVVPDPREEFAGLREADHNLVQGLDLWERKRVAAQEGPVLAWNAVFARTNDGQMRMGNPPVFDTTQMSRTGTSTRRDIELSVVMVDSDALAGIDGVTLADYATMRALARTRTPIDPTSVDTILNLFTPDAAAPARLSPFDLAYLSSLYDGAANRPMNMAMGSLGSNMVRELRGEDGS